jgi:hypothetical protein
MLIIYATGSGCDAACLLVIVPESATRGAFFLPFEFINQAT